MIRSKHGLFVFPLKKTLIWRRHCSIGQSWCSMTSKRRIVWFLESSSVMKFFHPSVRLPTKSHARLYPFDESIKSLYFCSFVVSVLFLCFHFKVTRKKLCENLTHLGMLYVHDAFYPGLRVILASHMYPNIPVYNRVTLVNGPILMTL